MLSLEHYLPPFLPTTVYCPVTCPPFRMASAGHRACSVTSCSAASSPFTSAVDPFVCVTGALAAVLILRIRLPDTAKPRLHATCPLSCRPSSQFPDPRASLRITLSCTSLEPSLRLSFVALAYRTALNPTATCDSSSAQPSLESVLRLCALHRCESTTMLSLEHHLPPFLPTTVY